MLNSATLQDVDTNYSNDNIILDRHGILRGKNIFRKVRPLVLGR
jgi:hypothetical protein